MEDIRKKAKELGVQAGRVNKIELIRSIQTAEGNSPCFATVTDYCDQFTCCFMEDCLGRETKSPPKAGRAPSLKKRGSVRKSK
ncbi:MAG: SAP domain-containing protein [Deltaproteobacteria bacterium]|nr:SAP domain-containing protein [Deltaproteobacteria bacterium]